LRFGIWEILFNRTLSGADRAVTLFVIEIVDVLAVEVVGRGMADVHQISPAVHDAGV
jgi:hypothetical protein